MTRRKPFSILIEFVLTIVLFGCSGSVLPQSETQSNECLSSTEKLAIPIHQNDLTKLNQEEKFYPPLTWQAVANLPSPYILSKLNFVMRSDNEIWLIASRTETGSDAVLRYQIDQNQWDIFSSIDNIPAAPIGLISSPDGTIWGFGSFLQTMSVDKEDIASLQTIPILSRYNQSKGQFEFVIDSGQLLKGERLGSSSPVRFDSHGNLWMAMKDIEGQSEGMVLYRFDPATLQTKSYRIKEGKINFEDFIFDKDDTIWILDAQNGEILHYNQITGDYKNALLSGGNGFSKEELTKAADLPLYLDREGRLWISDLAWLDTQAPSDESAIKLYRVIRSTAFIDNVYLLWRRPYAILESSNGLFWFSSAAGVVQLDPKTATWCRFTTADSNVIEDGQKNLWMIAYNKIYRKSP